jgi:tRNA (guanosine-2'-O-)-methyltransferase
MGINNTEACFRQLRTNGYTIVGTVTSPDAIPLEELDLTKKVALVFGNELDGLSNYATQAADVRSRIPLFGFTESFNISVAAAIYLYHLITRLQSMDIEWRLSDHEKLDVKLDWLKRSVQRSEILEKAYLKSNA